MKFRDHINMCWNLVLRNRRRYKAVLAAIAFGTAGFIIVRTMGDSVEKNLGDHLELLGEATVIKAHWDNYDSYHPGNYKMTDVARLKKLPHVVAVAPVVSLFRVEANFLTNSWMPGLMGVDQAYWKTQTPTISSGRLIGPSDVVGKKTVCVLGEDVVKNVFASEDPVGKEIQVGNLGFKVIGVLGGIQHSEIRRAVIIPISTAQKIFPGLYWISDIYVRADNWNEVASVRENVLRVLEDAHKGYETGIRAQYFPERIRKVTSTVFMVKVFIYASLVVAFILGKVGLTSIMLAAVQDRTREIGLRKALGAEEELILLQFLTESVFVSLLAGGLGVAIGILAVQLLKGPLGVDVSGYVMSSSILLDLIFTLSIAMWAGLYPARQAAGLDPVTAMRFE